MYLDKITNWHNRFKKWKPIHWCWWFEKHGLSIPSYLIGGSPVVDQRNWIIGDDDNADPDLCSWDTENTVRVGQTKEVDFMIRFQIANDGGGILNNANFQIFGNTVDDVDTAVQVTTSGTIMKISITGMPDDQDPTTENVMTAQAETWANGLYTDNADESGKYSLEIDYYTEIQFCVQFTSSAGDSTDYYFWIFANDTKANGTYNSPTCKITTAASGTTYYQNTGQGAVAQVGTLSKKTTPITVMGGHAVSIAGILNKKTTPITVTGGHAMSIAGSLTKAVVFTQDTGGHAMTITGTLSTVITFVKVIGGHALTIAGALVKKISIGTGNGQVVPTGILSKKTSKYVGGGSVMSIGTLVSIILFVQAAGGASISIIGSLATQFIEDTGIVKFIRRRKTFYKQ